MIVVTLLEPILYINVNKCNMLSYITVAIPVIDLLYLGTLKGITGVHTELSMVVS